MVGELFYVGEKMHAELWVLDGFRRDCMFLAFESTMSLTKDFEYSSACLYCVFSLFGRGETGAGFDWEF